MGQTLRCYKSARLHPLPLNTQRSTDVSSEELGPSSLLWPLGPLSFVRKANRCHIVEAIPCSAPTKADQRTQHKTSSCQMVQLVLKLAFIPVDSQPCFARRTMGLGLSSSSPVNFILNEIVLTLSSKMPSGLHSWNFVPRQWDISISKGAAYCNSTTNTKSADGFLSKPSDTGRGRARNFKCSPLAFAKFRWKKTCHCCLDL